MASTRRTSLLAAALIGALAALPAPGTAQLDLVDDGEWRLDLTPRIGFLQPGASGPLDGWQPEGLRIVGGPVFGLALELSTPVPWFSVRATMDRSARNHLRRDGRLDPVRDDDPFLRSSLSALQEQWALGGVLRPFAGSPVRPTALAGLGVRHWNTDPGDLPASLVPRFPESRWDRTWHWGAGVEADAEPFSIRVEVVNHRARIEDSDFGRSDISDRFFMLVLRWNGPDGG